jgi:hypothetical protein
VAVLLADIVEADHGARAGGKAAAMQARPDAGLAADCPRRTASPSPAGTLRLGARWCNKTGQIQHWINPADPKSGARRCRYVRSRNRLDEGR